MAALVQFTKTLMLGNSRPTAQGNQLPKLATNNNNNNNSRTSLRISCSKELAGGVEAAAVSETISNGIPKLKQLASADAFTPQNICRGAATKTAEDLLECQLQAALESERDVFCDILPNSQDCQGFPRSSSQSSLPVKEVSADGIPVVVGSKKLLRLSCVTSDVLD